MSEDNLRLREELAQLQKDIKAKIHIKDTLDAHVLELHKEELRYIEEIPAYKKQSQEAKDAHGVLSGKTISIMASLSKVQSELDKTKELVDQENRNLENLKQTQGKIIEETKGINEKIKQDHMQLKQREIAVLDREKSAQLREVGHDNKDLELNKREIELDHQYKQHTDRVKDLDDSISLHGMNIEAHNKKVDTFLQMKELHASDEQILKDKLTKVDILIKDNVELKSQLILQADKMSQATKIAESKQRMLDKAIDDLKNQENVLKIKEMKILKMVRDKGLREELKQLEESLK